MMKQLSHLVLGCSLLTLSETGLSNQTTGPEKNTASSRKNSLSSEEMRYITLECEGFANEDNIILDKRSIYIETCINELSTAVKDALESLPAKPEPLVIGKYQNKSN